MNKATPAANMTDMIGTLTNLLAQVENGEVDAKKVGLMCNVAGRITAASAVQVKYYAMQKAKPRIRFMSTRGNSDEQV